MKTIILASASPRRRELLANLDLPFIVLPSQADEEITAALPYEIVQELSRRKALSTADMYPEDCLVIGSDTLVFSGSSVLGKPKDEEDAFAMLQTLSGKTHQVYSGVTILEKKAGMISASTTFFEKTDVHVASMSSDEIRSYIAKGECLDKAGAYGIQGAFSIFITGIEGDYYNVVGLPIARLYQELKSYL